MIGTIGTEIIGTVTIGIETTGTTTGDGSANMPVNSANAGSESANRSAESIGIEIMTEIEIEIIATKGCFATSRREEVNSSRRLVL